jgi:hypothetical protein
MIDQLTVFLGNDKGRLTAMCRALGNAGIQMHSLVLADTTDYGIVRVICDNPQGATTALAEAGFTASLAKVLAVEVPNVPGGLADVFAALDAADVNIEYSYCFTNTEGKATLALKVDQNVKQELADAGFGVLSPSDLYAE